MFIPLSRGLTVDACGRKLLARSTFVCMVELEPIVAARRKSHKLREMFRFEKARHSKHRL